MTIGQTDKRGISAKPMKPKACKHCKSVFTPTKRMQVVCGLERARLQREAKERKQAKERAKVDRMMDKQQRAKALQTIPELIAIADKAFQEFIRWRDRVAGHACISSGQPLDWWTPNKVDGGHYRTKGAASHLRYNEDNCHAQTKQENKWKAGNAVDYRIHLIERIGLARVEALECDNEPIKWTREVLREIAVVYRAKTRELKRKEKRA